MTQPFSRAEVTRDDRGASVLATRQNPAGRDGGISEELVRSEAVVVRGLGIDRYLCEFLLNCCVCSTLACNLQHTVQLLLSDVDNRCRRQTLQADTGHPLL